MAIIMAIIMAITPSCVGHSHGMALATSHMGIGHATTMVTIPFR